MVLRAIGTALFALAAFAALAFLLQSNRNTRLAASAGAANAVAAANAVPAPSAAFSATGTITYYPNNAGTPVPYLVYELSDGSTATKALLFEDDSLCNALTHRVPCPLIQSELNAYFGQRFVRVSGVRVAEHVLVASLSEAPR